MNWKALNKTAEGDIAQSSYLRRVCLRRMWSGKGLYIVEMLVRRGFTEMKVEDREAQQKGGR